MASAPRRSRPLLRATVLFPLLAALLGSPCEKDPKLHRLTCSYVDQPILDEGSCRGCETSDECAACTKDEELCPGNGSMSPKPICETSTGICRECVASSDCPPGEPACDPAGHTCRSCQASAECPAGLPACVGGQCVECAGPAECPPGRPVCDPAEHTCRSCRASAECPAGRPACVDSQCVECASRTDCPADRPICTPAAGGAPAGAAPAGGCGCGGPGGVFDNYLEPAQPYHCRACADSMECAGSEICDQGACVVLSGRCRGNSDCTSDRPICVDRMCRECARDQDCASGLLCVDNTCRECQLHAQCASQVCDVYRVGPKGKPGACLAPEDVVYVDNRDGTCTGGHQGTLADPFCTIQTAVAQRGTRPAVRVLKSKAPYEGFLVSSGKVQIFGPDSQDGTARVVGATAAAATIDGTADVTLDGLELLGHDSRSSGVLCNSPQAGLEIRRSAIAKSQPGVLVFQCRRLRLDRSKLSENDGAILIKKDNFYEITNNIIIGNLSQFSPAITLEIGTQGVFQFNTVAYNRALAVPGGINCGPTGARVEYSIFSENSSDPMSSTQFVGACTLVKTVVGAADTVPGGVRKEPLLDAAFKLVRGTQDNACCIDQVPSASVTVDYFGTPRPQGGAFDIGAHEVP